MAIGSRQQNYPSGAFGASGYISLLSLRPLATGHGGKPSFGEGVGWDGIGVCPQQALTALEASPHHSLPLSTSGTTPDSVGDAATLILPRPQAPEAKMFM